jgi:hypothetical protein
MEVGVWEACEVASVGKCWEWRRAEAKSVASGQVKVVFFL